MIVFTEFATRVWNLAKFLHTLLSPGLFASAEVSFISGRVYSTQSLLLFANPLSNRISTMADSRVRLLRLGYTHYVHADLVSHT